MAGWERALVVGIGVLLLVVLPAYLAWYFNREGWILGLPAWKRWLCAALCFVPLVGMVFAWLFISCERYGLNFWLWAGSLLLVQVVVGFGTIFWLAAWWLRVRDAQGAVNRS
ncbi:MAG: hypothetical protein WC072_06130 [Methanoregulaceae archaeon]